LCANYEPLSFGCPVGYVASLDGELIRACGLWLLCDEEEGDEDSSARRRRKRVYDYVGARSTTHSAVELCQQLGGQLERNSGDLEEREVGRDARVA
jgi:hypothetical protein